MPTGGFCGNDREDYEGGYSDGKHIVRSDLANVLNRMRSTANASDKAVLDAVASQMKLRREETVTYRV